MNLLIFGSSITWGAWDKEGGWAQRLKSYCDHKAAETNFDNYTAVYCLGVSGDNTFDLLKRFDTEVEARIDKNEKTLILIEIGINDSQFVLEKNKHRVSSEEYKNNLLSLVEKSKRYSASLIFVGLTPVDRRVNPTPWTPGKTYRLEFVKQYEDILENIAHQQSIPFIELMSKFPEDSYQKLLTDGLHPSSEGHRLIYEKVKQYLIGEHLIWGHSLMPKRLAQYYQFLND
jgi:acyl-CoA thioesterase-1